MQRSREISHQAYLKKKPFNKDCGNLVIKVYSPIKGTYLVKIFLFRILFLEARGKSANL